MNSQRTRVHQKTTEELLKEIEQINPGFEFVNDLRRDLREIKEIQSNINMCPTEITNYFTEFQNIELGERKMKKNELIISICCAVKYCYGYIPRDTQLIVALLSTYTPGIICLHMLCFFFVLVFCVSCVWQCLSKKHAFPTFYLTQDFF